MNRAAAVLAGVAAVGLAWYFAARQNAADGGIGGAGWAEKINQAGQSVADGAATVLETIKGVLGMRGIRNNNPGNIRHGGTKWQGMSAEQTDAAFVQFDTPEAGIRALAVLLNTYATKYGLNTVRGIINRYAPTSENNTAAYIIAVSDALRVFPDQPISVKARQSELIQAIIKHENGAQPYDLATIQTGMNLA